MKPLQLDICSFINQAHVYYKYIKKMEHIVNSDGLNFDYYEYKMKQKLCNIAVTQILKKYNIDVKVGLHQFDMSDEYIYICENIPYDVDIYFRFGWKYATFKWNDPSMESKCNEIATTQEEANNLFKCIKRITTNCCEVVDYVFILYHPQMGRLNKYAKSNRTPLTSLSKKYIKRMTHFAYGNTCPIVSGKNGFYILFFMWEDENNPIYDIHETEMCVGRLFDAFILSEVYKMVFGEANNE